MGKAKGKDKEMKTFKEISQGLKTKYYNKADATNRHGQAFMKTQAASHFGKPGDAEKLQKRYHSISNKMATARPPHKEDSDAVKAFLAKGGKITKLPPGKAAGWHGKDDSGKDVHGMIDKPDIKAMPTRKKVKSMGEESTDVKELSSPTLKNYIKKAEKEKDKYYSQYQKLRRSQDKKHGEFSPDMGKTKEVGRKAVNRDDGVYRAYKTLTRNAIKKQQGR